MQSLDDVIERDRRMRERVVRYRADPRTNRDVVEVGVDDLSDYDWAQQPVARKVTDVEGSVRSMLDGLGSARLLVVISSQHPLDAVSDAVLDHLAAQMRYRRGKTGPVLPNSVRDEVSVLRGKTPHVPRERVLLAVSDDPGILGTFVIPNYALRAVHIPHPASWTRWTIPSIPVPIQWLLYAAALDDGPSVSQRIPGVRRAVGGGHGRPLRALMRACKQDARDGTMTALQMRVATIAQMYYRAWADHGDDLRREGFVAAPVARQMRDTYRRLADLDARFADLDRWGDPTGEVADAYAAAMQQITSSLIPAARAAMAVTEAAEGYRALAGRMDQVRAERVRAASAERAAAEARRRVPRAPSSVPDRTPDFDAGTDTAQRLHIAAAAAREMDG